MVDIIAIVYVIIGAIFFGAICNIEGDEIHTDSEIITVMMVILSFFWPFALLYSIGAYIGRKIKNKRWV